MVHKVQSGFLETRKNAYDITAREYLNTYLFSDVHADHVEEAVLYRQQLEPLLFQLQKDLRMYSESKNSAKRRSLKRVALGLTSEVIGETRVRLNMMFEYFGFVDEAIDSLRDAAWWIRAKGCRNAGLMMSELSLPYLEECLDDEYEDVRIEAAQAMITIAGVGSLAPILMRLKDLSLWMQVRLSNSILKFQAEAVPQLSLGIKSEYPAVQGFCIDLLGMIGDVSAVPTILEYISFENPDVQQKSLIAFGRNGDQRAIPIIQKFLDSDDRNLRLAAAKAAISLSSPAIAYDLHKHLLKDEVEIQLASAEALSRSGETGIKSLLYASTFNDLKVRLIAHQFLHDLGVTVPDAGGETA